MKRFEMIEADCYEDPTGEWVRWVDVERELARRREQHHLCKASRCNNEGRYSSGYCGIHDILLNDAKGTLVSKRRRAVCAECGTTNMDNHYAKVPGKGDLCLACWNKWRESK